MRKRFGELLAARLAIDESAYLLCGDVGYGVLDAAFAAAPDRCFNMGAAEQTMIGAAVGLTYEGKTPFVYTITPFLLYRPFELLLRYVHEERAPVKLVGCGRGEDYASLGSTHRSDEQGRVLDILSNVRAYFPEDEDGLERVWGSFVAPGPAYLNLRRT